MHVSTKYVPPAAAAAALDCLNVRLLLLLLAAAVLLEERDERETFMNSQTASLDLELKFEVGDGDR